MKIIVDKMPENAHECLFSWKHVEYAKRRCRFGGVCKIENNENCKFLQEIDYQGGILIMPTAKTGDKND